MIAALVRFFCGIGGRFHGMRLFGRGGGAPIISGLARSWLALGAFRVLFEVTLIMSRLSISPCGIMGTP